MSFSGGKTSQYILMTPKPFVMRDFSAIKLKYIHTFILCVCISLYVCMCIYMCVCLCMYICMHAYICVCVYHVIFKGNVKYQRIIISEGLQLR